MVPPVAMSRVRGKTGPPGVWCRSRLSEVIARTLRKRLCADKGLPRRQRTRAGPPRGPVLQHASSSRAGTSRQPRCSTCARARPRSSRSTTPPRRGHGGPARTGPAARRGRRGSGVQRHPDRGGHAVELRSRSSRGAAGALGASSSPGRLGDPDTPTAPEHDPDISLSLRTSRARTVEHVNPAPHQGVPMITRSLSTALAAAVAVGATAVAAPALAGAVDAGPRDRGSRRYAGRRHGISSTSDAGRTTVRSPGRPARQPAARTRATGRPDRAGPSRACTPSGSPAARTPRS